MDKLKNILKSVSLINDICLVFFMLSFILGIFCFVGWLLGMGIFGIIYLVALYLKGLFI